MKGGRRRTHKRRYRGGVGYSLKPEEAAGQEDEFNSRQKAKRMHRLYFETVGQQPFRETAKGALLGQLSKHRDKAVRDAASKEGEDVARSRHNAGELYLLKLARAHQERRAAEEALLEDGGGRRRTRRRKHTRRRR